MGPESINFDLESARQLFAGANAVANNILDQNDRGSLIEQDLEDEDFQALAHDGLCQEQEATLAELQKLSKAAPYAQAGEATLKLAGRQKEISAQIQDIEDELELKRWEVDEQAQKTARIAPLIGEKARQLAEEKKTRISDERLPELYEQAQAISDARQKLDELFADAIGSWPAPTVCDRTALVIEELVADEMPVNPDIHDHEQGERLRKFSERHVDESIASQYIAFYLADKADKIISVDELINFVYKSEVIETRDRLALRSRITTMLGPKIQGKRIQGMLEAEGFELQYGIRRVTKIDTSTNKIIETRRERIYRAVREESLRSEHLEPIHEEVQTDLEKETVNITWSITTEQLEQAIENDQLEGPQPAHPEPEQKPEATRQAPVKKSLFRRRNHNGESLRELGRDIKAAIEALDADGLICSEPMSQKTIISRSSSRILGTKTAIERLVNSGLLPRSILKEKEIFLTAAQLVTMQLHNTHRQALGKNNREAQRRAVEMIENDTAGYLKLKSNSND